MKYVRKKKNFLWFILQPMVAFLNNHGLYKKADINETSTPKLYEKYIKQLLV